MTPSGDGQIAHKGRFGPMLPRRTVRLRLTLLYGGLFLLSGLLLLLLTNLLVRHATGERFVGVLDPAVGDVMRIRDGTEQRVIGLNEGVSQLADQEIVRILREQADEFRAAAGAQRAADRRQLLVYSGVALGIMSMASIALGWIVAGRVLSPLRTITSTARGISATNLHERLSVKGPDDELKDLGDTFDELLSRLEQAFEAQRQFVANASHELRTPLARQRTLMEVALADPDATVESLSAAFRRALASGEQQERLIESLLTLARSERGLERKESVNLTSIVEEQLAARQYEIEHNELMLDRDLNPATTSGDPSLAERLVSNLLDNAIRYNLPGGSLEISTWMNSSRSVVRVANSGTQIPPEEVEGMFKPFRRWGRERTAAADGYGLGLPIVKAVAMAHGATLNAHVRLSGGLEIEVSFPLAKGAPGN